VPDTAEFTPPALDAPGEAKGGEAVRDGIFVRAIDLPTLSARQAKAAVAQQLDILSPLPPAEVVFSVVLIGPVEAGLNRFAVGFAPRELLVRMIPEGQRAGALTGWLDDQEVLFRFDRPGARPGEVDWRARLEIATIAGLCLAIVLAAASFRLDRENERLQARIDAANAQVQQLSRETAALARVGDAWRAAQATRKAALLDCALGDLAKAGGGPVALSKLTLSDGQIEARLSTPASDAMLTALKALGFAPTQATQPDPSAPPVVRDVQTNAADCR
jgi:hypothetical protein